MPVHCAARLRRLHCMVQGRIAAGLRALQVKLVAHGAWLQVVHGAGCIVCVVSHVVHVVLHVAALL